METLAQKQQRFTLMIAELVIWAYKEGYKLTYGDAYRSPECAEMMRKKGKGIALSLHSKRLAVDFNLFIGGKYRTNTVDYERLGHKWESMGGTWGGRFKDGNHFSLEHNGIR